MIKYIRTSLLCGSVLVLGACSSSETHSDQASNVENTSSANQQSQNNLKHSSEQKTSHSANIQQAYQVEKVAQFNEPWAIVTLPDQRLLITERKGVLKIFNPLTKQSTVVSGVPKSTYGGQGGLGDVVLHPQFEKNQWIYLSFAQSGQGGHGAVVVRAKLDTSATQPKLTNIEEIWQQVPKVSGKGHYAHRLVFDREGKLWIASGERQKFDPAQDMKSNLGKIVRLNDDGTPVKDNPFYQQGGVAAQVWSLGHRNPLGIAFDQQNQLWVVEMGPKGGDELNRIVKGENYGYPIVSNGDHYSGKPIPNHSTRPEFKAPEVTWTPVISPSSLMIYQGNQFPAWKDKALIGGLSSESITVVNLKNKPAQEVQRLQMKERIRGLAEAQDGSIWVIEDGPKANLLKLTAQP